MRRDEPHTEQSASARRICIATRRGVSRQAFQAAPYEAEDVLAATCSNDLIEVKAGRNFSLRNRWQRRLLFRGISQTLAYANPGLQRVQLSRDYDIFVAVCQNIGELLYFNAIDGWKERCGVSICWLGELWAAEIPIWADLLRSLRRFDYIFVSSQGAVGPLSAFLDRQCHLMPTGIDTLRFSPFPKVPDRSIDIYSVGRRWDGVHRALLDAAAQRKLFYVYDSCLKVAEMQVVDHRQHRDLFANMAKRSKYFLVAPGKMNLPEETLGQVEIGYRYFEAAASGAVMLGQPADCELFGDLFPWPDAVVKIKADGSDILDVLATLGSAPDHLAAIHRRNATHAMLRHDWIHRWIDIFQIAGVDPTPEMIARRDHLNALAQSALGTPVPVPAVEVAGSPR